jgi:D-3-phosphoglycerate dehydrogenase
MEEKRSSKVVAQKLPDRSVPVYGEGFSIEEQIFDKAGIRLVVTGAERQDAFMEVAGDADALLVYAGGIQINRAVIASLKRCQIIAVAAVGYDNVDIEAASGRSIWVTNVPDVFIEEVADHTMALILAAWRRLLFQDQLVRTGRWNEARPFLNQFPRLTGQTLGFISFGNVPKAVSHRAAPFGLRMMAYDPYISELVMIEHGVEPMTELPELLRQSDFVSAHLPLSDETRHLISTEAFKQMKSSAIFINTGRGATVDEASLIQALSEGWIAGAALDVFEEEPVDTGNPLLQMDSVTLTAHAASASSRMPPETRRRAANEIVRVLKGAPPISPVNKFRDSVAG